jgi:hypothetical protein
MDRWGREALEGMLGLVAYIVFAEHCTSGGSQGAIFKTFRQRSAGPLWAMFKKCASLAGAKWELSKELLTLGMEPHLAELDRAVSQIAQTKHGKRAENLDYAGVLEKVGNALAKATRGKLFGYFEDARRKPFSMSAFQGIFRNARGASPPFIDVYEYEGSEDFPQEFVFLFDIERGVGLPLFPMLVRGVEKTRSHHEEPDFFLYDIVRQDGKEIAFKAVQERGEICLDSKSQLAELFGATAALLRQDPRLNLVTGVKLTMRSLE